jgi:hypothetical protein
VRCIALDIEAPAFLKPIRLDSNNSEETKADNSEGTNDKDVFKKPIIHSSELDSDAVSEETIKGM